MSTIDRGAQDRRIAEAMTSFAADYEADEARWAEIEDGVVTPRAVRPRRRSGSPVLGVAAAVLVVAAIAAAMLLRSDAGSTGRAGPPDGSSASTASSSTSSSSVPDVRDLEVPEGKVPVADHQGGIAGFVDADAESSSTGYPTLDLPSAEPVRGLEVTDGDGVLVGYFVEVLGFVDRATAETPGEVDRLRDEWEAYGSSPERQQQADDFLEEDLPPDAPTPPG